MKITIDATPTELAELIFALVDYDVDVDDDDEEEEDDDDDVPRSKGIKITFDGDFISRLKNKTDSDKKHDIDNVAKAIISLLKKHTT